MLPVTPNAGAGFSTKAGRPAISFSQFAWARTEVTALNRLHELDFYFWEKDTVHPTMGFLVRGQRTLNNLVPGQTKLFKGNLDDEASSNKKDSTAYYEYTKTYRLRLYPER